VSDPVTAPASWYDGLTAARHTGMLVWDGGPSFVLHDDRGESSQVNFADLTHLDKRRDELVFSRSSNPDFRLTLPRDLPDALEHHLPRAGTYGKWVDRIGLWRAAVAFGVVSAAALTLFLTAPDWLGPRVPESWERKLGEAMVGDFGNRVCHTPAGDAALAKLVARVDTSGEPVKVGVANIDMVNAVALPGAQVLVFNGLLREAESPEEVAGVLAHEVGHVRERHVMTAVLRQFGLSILATGFNSSVSETLFGVASLGYSRDAEREADDFARMRMGESDISPLGSAGFFERMAKQYGDEADDRPAVVGWMATHPSSGDRAKAYRTGFVKGHDYQPVLTAEEFSALKSMCSQDKDVESFDLFS